MFDIAVIGLGPAGLEVSKQALKSGLSVVAFEQNELGGTCLNVGCVPTKSILHCAKTYKELKYASDLGLNLTAPLTFDWQKIIERKENIVSKFTKLLNSTLSKKLTLVKAKAELVSDSGNLKIKAQNELFEASHIIIATGSKPAELANLAFDNKFILNSDDILNLKELPKSIAIVGSGAIGSEWAMILSMLDVKVYLIEKAPVLAPALDVDIQKRIDRIFKQNSIVVFKDDYIVSIDNHNITLNSSKSFEVDCVLCAVGRTPLLPPVYDLKTGSELSINEIDNKNLYLTGDVSNSVMLAHNASFEAYRLIQKIINKKEIPSCQIPKIMYLTPEVASIGLNEQDIENKENYTIKKALLSSIAKSWCDNSTDGFIKLIIKDNLIKGAHVVSPEASSIITVLEVLIQNKIPIDEIKNLIFAHPSYSELIIEALNND